jgi:hypothetical protein
MSSVRPRRRNEPKAWREGEPVDIVVARGLDPSGGLKRGAVRLSTASQYGAGTYLVRYDDGREDIVHVLRMREIADE